MNQKIKQLRDNVTRLTEDLEKAKALLKTETYNCDHDWSPPVSAHIYEPGYTIPGDPPGTMGIDWRGPTYVDAKTTKRWKRTCSICGEIQYTNEIVKTVVENPIFL